MRSVLSQRDMSESTTVSPSCNPSTIWIEFTDARPTFTGTLSGFVSIGPEFEKTDRAVLLPERRASHIQNIVQAFQVDGAVHAQIGPRAFRQFAC